MRPSDFDIIAGCKRRDPKAVEWLYKTHSPWMLGICMRYFSDRMEAEDIVHESFIAICDKIGSLKDEKALEAWMKRIVVNNCLMGLRKKATTVAVEEVFDAN
jgi:RNA polymerase sigma-70 factor (ECF subfamily)